MRVMTAVAEVWLIRWRASIGDMLRSRRPVSAISSTLGRGAQAIADGCRQLDHVLAEDLRQFGLAQHKIVAYVRVEPDDVMIRRERARIAIGRGLESVFHRAGKVQGNVLSADRLAETTARTRPR